MLLGGEAALLALLVRLRLLDGGHEPLEHGRNLRLIRRRLPPLRVNLELPLEQLYEAVVDAERLEVPPLGRLDPRSADRLVANARIVQHGELLPRLAVRREHVGERAEVGGGDAERRAGPSAHWDGDGHVDGRRLLPHAKLLEAVLARTRLEQPERSEPSDPAPRLSCRMALADAMRGGGSLGRAERPLERDEHERHVSAAAHRLDAAPPALAVRREERVRLGEFTAGGAPLLAALAEPLALGHGGEGGAQAAGVVRHVAPLRVAQQQVIRIQRGAAHLARVIVVFVVIIINRVSAFGKPRLEAALGEADPLAAPALEEHEHRVCGHRVDHTDVPLAPLVLAAELAAHAVRHRRRLGVRIRAVLAVPVALGHFEQRARQAVEVETLEKK